jgi:hypothetical protein
MIIILAPDDADLVRAAQAQAYNFPEIYGRAYIAGQDQIPQLGPNESLYFTGHGVKVGDGGNAEIGDENGDLAMDGLELWDNFRHVFPDMWDGSVYVSACESADFARGMFSIIEVFKTQADMVFDGAPIYGQTGSPGFDIPNPGSQDWFEA